MGESTSAVELSEALAEFSLGLKRTVDRLSTMPLSRLNHRDPEGITPADRAFAVAQQLVDCTYELTGSAPPALPRLRSHGVAAQLEVVGHDLIDQAAAANLRGPAAEAVKSLTSELRTLRTKHL